MKTAKELRKEFKGAIFSMSCCMTPTSSFNDEYVKWLEQKVLSDASQYTTNNFTQKELEKMADEIADKHYWDKDEEMRSVVDAVIQGIRNGLSLSTPQEKQPEREMKEFKISWSSVESIFIDDNGFAYNSHHRDVFDWLKRNYPPIVTENRQQITEGKEEANNVVEDEDVQIFIDGVERIKALVKNAKYGNAEQTKKELIEKLNDLV